MKLWIVFSDNNEGNPYQDFRVVARSKEKAIEKLEKMGKKPDTWCGEWKILEDLYVFF